MSVIASHRYRSLPAPEAARWHLAEMDRLTHEMRLRMIRLTRAASEAELRLDGQHGEGRAPEPMGNWALTITEYEYMRGQLATHAAAVRALLPDGWVVQEGYDRTRQVMEAVR